MKSSFSASLILIFSVLLLFSCSKDSPSDNPPSGDPVPKVLLVGIDGLQFEQIDLAHTPNLNSLYTTRAFTGGYTGTETRQYTWSGPGWASILTGTWMDRHGIPGNLGTYQYQTPSVFSYIKEQKSNSYLAAIVNWNRIFEVQENQLSKIDYRFSLDWQEGDESIQEITAQTINQIKTKGPDLVFAMYLNVDETGHIYGFGPQYTQAVEDVDVELGKLLDAVNQRMADHHEDWLVMVTTDHGRMLPDGKHHGELSTSEKTIFIKMNKPGNESFRNYYSDVPNRENDGIYGYASQTSITPTILRHLNLEIKEVWSLGDGPLVGAEGPMRLMFADEEQNRLFWHYTGNEEAQIFKNGNLIATVEANTGNFLDEDTLVPPDADNRITYVVNIAKSTAYITKKVED